MSKLLRLCLMFVILISISCLAETIYVDQYNPIINTTTNQTQNNTQIMTGSDFERLYNLTDKLVTLEDTLIKQSGYMRTLSERMDINERRYIDSLDESTKTILKLLDIIENEKNLSREYELKTAVKIETLQTRINSVVNDSYKDKIWTVIKVIVAIVVTALVTMFIVRLSKGKKLYFVLKWIRDRIPINF